NNGSAKALPPDVFLICGDRAWQGIPKNVYGGPCYFGKLTLLASDKRWWETITGISKKKKRAVRLSPNCRDDVSLLSTTERILLSVLVPNVAVANVLNQIGKLACWAEKQVNVTTKILEQLLEDQNSLRHAILQNRAAIDFLLLAQGHGCEGFEGMCCLNLSNHGESIHRQIQWLKNHANKIQQSQGWLDNWLPNLFGDIPGWLTGLLTKGIRFLVIIMLMGICLCL
ncbi:ERB1 protein, partial [Herpetotheres cachinnans]|nr:ERB1 protein [Herpetotheres cachinnans]